MTGTEFAIAIAGLVSTVVSSGLGLYFTSRARTASYRDLLYEKQLALVTDILEAAAKLDALGGMVLTTKDEPNRKKAWAELQEQLSQTNSLGARAAVLLPNQVYAAFGVYHHIAVRILVDSGARSATPSLLEELRARSAHLMEFCRALVGVEALSAETQALLAGDTVERVGKTDIAHYLENVKRASLES